MRAEPIASTLADGQQGIVQGTAPEAAGMTMALHARVSYTARTPDGWSGQGVSKARVCCAAFSVVHKAPSRDPSALRVGVAPHLTQPRHPMAFNP